MNCNTRHYGFSAYDVLFPNGTLLYHGGKLSYCVVTTQAYQQGPRVICPTTSNFTCSAQGLEPGNIDRYSSDLDCQWLQLTDLQAFFNNWFIYRVHINQARFLEDYSMANNVYEWPIYIPCAPLSATVGITYTSFLQQHPEVCCFRPGGPVPGLCDAPAGGCTNAQPLFPCQVVDPLTL